MARPIEGIAAAAALKQEIGETMGTGIRVAIAGWILCTGIWLAGVETSAQSMPKEVAARVELYAIPSLTISDQQFLSGDANGKPATVAGEFRVAQGSGRLPVVVLMHGSSGVGANIEPWVHQFNRMGISTFVIDGFSGRGLTVVGPNQALLGRLNLIVDIYRSLDILAKHPRVDPERIVLMGFSRGGQAALYASLDRFNGLWNKSGAQFAGYIPFYPDCSTTYLTDTEVAARPIRIFHGTPDDYNPVASCKAYVGRLQDAKRDVVLTEYPDSQHAFDNGLLGLNTVTVSTNAQTARNCRIREGEGGVLMNADTQAPFGYKDACIELNPHVGGNPATAEKARKAVVDFLEGLLKLG
jgi:dienelactone hydrolase